MLTPNSVEILKALNKEEFKKFGDFVKSPYFNSVEVLGKIYDEVAKAFPEFDNTRLSYKKISQKIYPGKEFNEQTIRNLYSKFGNLLKMFIGYEEIAADNDLLDINIADGLSKKKLFAHSNKVIEKGSKIKSENHLLSASNFYYGFRMEHTHYFNLMQLETKHTTEFFDAFNNKMENLISFFIKTFFMNNQHHEILKDHYKNYTDFPITENFTKSLDIEKFFRLLEENKHEKYAYLKIQFLIHKSMTTPFAEEVYPELWKLVTDNIERFTKLEKLTTLTSVEAILIYRLIPKDAKYNLFFFDLVKFFCSMKIYPDEKLPIMEILQFRNFFTAGLLARDYEWTEKYADEYVNYIKPELKQNEFNYCKAIISFKNKKYEDSLNYFNKMVAVEIIEKIHVKIYTLMNYIELSAYEPAISMVQTLKQFGKENKELPDFKKDSFRNSVRFLDEIVKAVTGNKKIDKMVFDEAMSIRFFYQKQYIIDKMERLLE